MLNDDKTEFLIIGTRQQLAKFNINCITVDSTDVCPVTVARNLHVGSCFDEQLTTVYVNPYCGVAFCHLHNIMRICRYLSRELTPGMLVHALITSRVDYCNSLLYGLPKYQLNNLQRLWTPQLAPRFCHISPLVRGLHWLLVKAWIQFKILLITFLINSRPYP